MEYILSQLTPHEVLHRDMLYITEGIIVTSNDLE
jgi:hypothetical protein